MASFKLEREKMVASQIEGRGISDEGVLRAMRQVPRHLFVPEEARQYAYRDSPIKIGRGQTISQPYIVALMTSLLDVKQGHIVLDVGTGSGYQAAILAEMGAVVHSVERHPELAQEAKARLDSLGYKHVHVHVADGTQGLEGLAPFDRIVVAAAAPAVPDPLLDQLSDEGRLVIPVGSRFAQSLEVWSRTEEGFQREVHSGVVFVPLVGKHGW